MAPKALDFTKAIVTGGGGGIGLELSKYFVQIGKRVILVGRTEATLKAAAAQLGHDTAYYVLDTGKPDTFPEFAARVTREHPDVDGLVNNAGVQRPLEVGSLDLAAADSEIDIDIRGPVHLLAALLPHFKTRPAAVVMNVSSLLGFVPQSIMNPVYNGCKAFIHFYTLAARAQLAVQAPNVRVVELVPPTVATALHRERANPDDNKKEHNEAALDVGEFVAQVRAGLERDDDTIGAGAAKELVDKWQDAFGGQFDAAAAKWKQNPQTR